MPQDSSQRRRRRSRAELLAVFDRETRRMGSMATLHNHAVADYAGLHPTDQECIDLLDWTGPLTAGEIGVHLGLSSGAVTGLIDRLEAGGWVHRQRDPIDRRRVIVHFSTERGHELWALYQPLAEAIDAYRDRLDGRDLQAVVNFLQFANQAMAEATEHARSMRDRPGRDRSLTIPAVRPR
jgi:MarR family transcriptional regulator, organic hydroperoxide resistance regulator